MTTPDPLRAALEAFVKAGPPPDALMNDGDPSGKELRDWWLDRLAPALALARAALAADTAPLDAAWREAEAALPEGWSLLIGDERKRGKPGWWATASEPYDDVTRGFRIVSSSDDATLYDTPADALRALAVRLAKERDQG